MSASGFDRPGFRMLVGLGSATLARPGNDDRISREESIAMDAMTNDFGEVLLWSFWFFIWIAALMVWFRCLFDMFADHTLSGLAKAGWAVLPSSCRGSAP